MLVLLLAQPPLLLLNWSCRGTVTPSVESLHTVVPISFSDGYCSAKTHTYLEGYENGDETVYHSMKKAKKACDNAGDECGGITRERRQYTVRGPQIPKQDGDIVYLKRVLCSPHQIIFWVAVPGYSWTRAASVPQMARAKVTGWGADDRSRLQKRAFGSCRALGTTWRDTRWLKVQ